MILNHESESKENQFDGKNEGQKSRDTIPSRTQALQFSKRSNKDAAVHITDI
jgi:hypothetical protein